MISKRLTKQEAIKKKCLECSAGNKNEVANCEIKDCALWRYRNGYEEQDELYFKHMKKKGKK
ncbi:MAG: hypothetical protein WAO56_01215 [Miniphocaeibacter sp.]|jgi:hypothetical protein|uniref:hypothetical protein n=1 Tax=Miniphocaeibacter sp. TaxID=3100973 RepID=UPI001842A888|nr:hypothetical protein [Gallicola sp.]